MKTIQQLKASTLGYVVTGALCALAGFAIAETRNQMLVRPFEQVTFVPQDPKNLGGAQLAVLSR